MKHKMHFPYKAHFEILGIVLVVQLMDKGKTIAELQAGRVAEGPCFQPSLAMVINPIWFLTPREYYFPMASEYSYLNYAEVLLGRPAASWEELEEMCLKVQIKVLEARTFGYNSTIEQSCALTSYALLALRPGQLQCHVTGSSHGTNPSLFEDYLDNVVLTDNHSYVLYVRCVMGIRDYKVISVNPTLSEDVVLAVSRKVKELGFDPQLIRKLGCSKTVKYNISLP